MKNKVVVKRFFISRDFGFTGVQVWTKRPHIVSGTDGWFDGRGRLNLGWDDVKNLVGRKPSEGNVVDVIVTVEQSSGRVI